MSCNLIYKNERVRMKNPFHVKQSFPDVDKLTFLLKHAESCGRCPESDIVKSFAKSIYGYLDRGSKDIHQFKGALRVVSLIKNPLMRSWCRRLLLLKVDSASSMYELCESEEETIRLFCDHIALEKANRPTNVEYFAQLLERMSFYSLLLHELCVVSTWDTTLTYEDFISRSVIEE